MRQTRSKASQEDPKEVGDALDSLNLDPAELQKYTQQILDKVVSKSGKSSRPDHPSSSKRSTSSAILGAKRIATDTDSVKTSDPSEPKFAENVPLPASPKTVGSGIGDMEFLDISSSDKPKTQIDNLSTVSSRIVEELETERAKRVILEDQVRELALSHNTLAQAVAILTSQLKLASSEEPDTTKRGNVNIARASDVLPKIAQNPGPDGSEKSSIPMPPSNSSRKSSVVVVNKAPRFKKPDGW